MIFSCLKLDSGDLQDLKYGVFRIIGSGRIFFPRWNEEAATLESFDQRVNSLRRLLSTFDPKGDTFRYVRDNQIDVQLEAVDGSGALMIVRTIRLSVVESWSSIDRFKFRNQ